MTGPSRRGTALLLSVLFLGGLGLRAHDLGARTMGHTESYVPGIPLPEDFGEPRARLTLSRAVVNSMWEVHPPGWYAFMWAWTQAFGTSLVSIRLPGVLFGALCILLVYRLGVLEGGRAVALAGAALMACNGHQIYWAQVARPQTMLCAFGLLGSILLIRAARGNPRALAGYGVLVCIGLFLDYYFWILILAHAVWNLGGSRLRPATALAVLRTQLLAGIVASPVVTLAIFQSRKTHIEGTLGEGLRDLLQMGFLFSSVNPVPYDPPGDVALWLPWLGLALLALGLARGARSVQAPSGGAGTAGPPAAWIVLAAAGMTGAVLVAAGKLAVYAPEKSQALHATALVPAAGAALACAFPRVARRLRFPGEAASLTAMLAVLPALLVALATLHSPIFAARQMLLFVPYLLLIVGRGALEIAQRPGNTARAAAILLGLVLATAHARSVRWYADRLQSPHDYRALCERWAPLLEEDVPVLVVDHWVTTPVFYYLPHDRYRFVPRDWARAVEGSPRIWRLAFRDHPVPDGVVQALAGRTLEGAVVVEGVSAEIWAR